MSFSLNPVTWSLFHEIYVCLLLPVFTLLWVKGWRWTLLCGIPFFYILGQYFDYYSFGWGKNPLEYIYLFLAGFLVGRYSGHIAKIRWPRYSTVLVLMLMPFSRLFTQYGKYIFLHETGLAILVVMISLSQHKDACLRWLTSPRMAALGKMTLGLYLVHYPVAFLTATTMLNTLPQSLLRDYPVIPLFGSFIISVSLTYLLCSRFVYPYEQYWMNMRRRFATREMGMT